MIDFIKEKIVYKFRILELITIDQGSMFTGKEMKAFVED